MAHASSVLAATSATQPSTLHVRVMLATQWLLSGMKTPTTMMTVMSQQPVLG
jgi:hypothetical protein